MPSTRVFFLFGLIAVAKTINRPVYKIALTQKGFAQSLQYDLEIPPLKEFTFCSWLRFDDLNREQFIFTYLLNGDKSIVKLWLEPDGDNMILAVRTRYYHEWNIPVKISKDNWRQLCLSYQSDFGAWALYIDAKLVRCQSTRTLLGYVLPGGGSIIIGYGVSRNGSPAGFQGEIFGANMILISTIHRNHNNNEQSYFSQNQFSQNKVKDTSEHTKYTVLKDLKREELFNNSEVSNWSPNHLKSNRSSIKSSFPTKTIEYDVGANKEDYKFMSTKDESDILAQRNTFKQQNSNTFSSNIYEDVDNIKFDTTTKVQAALKYEKPFSKLEYSFPKDNVEKLLQMESSPTIEPMYYRKNSKPNLEANSEELLIVETPPPIKQDNKVYGQWTSSKFAGNVLNYLQNHYYLYNRRPQVIPSTIPLVKLTDSFPYASELKPNKIHINLLKNASEKRLDRAQRNIEILEKNLRSEIIKSHAQTKPKKVQILFRGNPAKQGTYRLHRNVKYSDTLNSKSEEVKEGKENSRPIPLFIKSNMKDNHSGTPTSLSSSISVLKADEYLSEDVKRVRKTIKENDSNSKISINISRWKSKKLFVPENMCSNENEHKIELNYLEEPMHSKSKYLGTTELRKSVTKGQQLAKEINNLFREETKDSPSTTKYNHAFLPGNVGKTEKNNYNLDFYKKVKLGNALNEGLVIGFSEQEKEKSFVGGIEEIPEIINYRSDIDHYNNNVPPSLGLRSCLTDDKKYLYVQSDGSIGRSNVIAPLLNENEGINFVLQNYKKCSWDESLLENNALLLINWSRTPVRLFGGATPIKTKDLCGFF